MLSFLQLVVSATVSVSHLVFYLSAVSGNGAPESSESGVSTIVPKTCIGSFPSILSGSEYGSSRKDIAVRIPSVDACGDGCRGRGSRQGSRSPGFVR